MSGITIFDDPLLQNLIEQAAANPRRRMNLNLHENLDDPSQRMLVAVQPDSYITPHRHSDKPECIVCISGQLAVVTFQDSGQIDQVVHLTRSGVTGCEIAAGTWHSLVSLSNDAVFLETKPGPYQPFQPGDFAPFAPTDTDENRGQYHSQLTELVAKAV